MEELEELISEDFNLTIEIWKATYKFKYKQATIYETIQFMKAKNLLDWMYEFLKEHSVDKKFNKIIFLNSSNWFKEYIKNLQNTFLRGAFEDKTADSKKKDTEEDTSEPNEFWWYLMSLSTALGVDPLKLMQNYTFQQANYLYFWAIYNSNKWSKEWEELNRSMIVNRTISKMDLKEKEALDDMFKNLSNLNTKTK